MSIVYYNRYDGWVRLWMARNNFKVTSVNVTIDPVLYLVCPSIAYCILLSFQTWCSQHLAHSKANMRRHDSKHAASIAGWKHIYFHKVLLYMQALVLTAPCAFESEYAQA
jgi:hypothetical protein